MSRLEQIKKQAADNEAAAQAFAARNKLVTDTAIELRQYLDSARTAAHADGGEQDEFEIEVLALALDPNVVQLLASKLIRQPTPAANPTPKKAKTSKPKAAPAASLPVAATPADPEDVMSTAAGGSDNV
jgi:uncharacterized membrane protein